MTRRFESGRVLAARFTAPSGHALPPFREQAAAALWARSVEACRKYLDKPNTADLFRAINPLCASTPLWNPGSCTAGVSHTGLMAYEEALSMGDADAARSHGHAVLTGFRDAVERITMRLVLAGRALLVHRRPAVADALLSDDGALADRNAHAQLDRLLLRIRCRVTDPDNIVLLKDVLRRLPAYSRVLVSEYVRYCLRYGLATPGLLNFLMAWTTDVPRDARQAIWGECVALALNLDDMDTVGTLCDPARLPANILERLLPLAGFLRDRGIPPAWRKQHDLIAMQADLHAHIVTQSRALAERIADPGRSVAIVGNSACELGQGRGREIDAHDMVIRFNLYSPDPAFAADYGSRCTIHARAIDKATPELTARSLAADAALFCLPNYLSVPRIWSHARELRRKGGRLACLPDGFHLGLQAELGTAPSSGLVICAFVQAIRKLLPATSCFGFSFTDQIEDPAAGVRYFDSTPPSMIHSWAREREIFERLTGRPPRRLDDMQQLAARPMA